MRAEATYTGKNSFLSWVEVLTNLNGSDPRGNQLNKKREYGIIYNKKFSVVPLTTHVPIKHVSKKISHRLIERKIFTLNSFFKNVFKKKPLIAVLGLNPHNAEHDYYSEENKIIVPSINKLKKKGYKVIGPFPADTIFSNQRKYTLFV